MPRSREHYVSLLASCCRFSWRFSFLCSFLDNGREGSRGRVGRGGVGSRGAGASSSSQHSAGTLENGKTHTDTISRRPNIVWYVDNIRPGPNPCTVPRSVKNLSSAGVRCNGAPPPWPRHAHLMRREVSTFVIQTRQIARSSFRLVPYSFITNGRSLLAYLVPPTSARGHRLYTTI
jgi:hypothetical protein